MQREIEETNELLSNINGYSSDKQQRIAVVTDKTSLVVAGAGAGKSLTIIGKIRYLIERKKVKESEILCISFTREAALNLEKNIKKNYNYNIPVYTFHKLALTILKNQRFKISDVNTLPYIVDEYFLLIKYDSNMKYRVKKVLYKIDTSYDILLKSKELMVLKKLIITFINLFKTNNYKLNDFVNFKGSKDLLRIIIDIYVLYEQELRSKKEIDFNDMIIKATDYIKTNEMHKYKYIIVDEYQDTSYIRYLLLKEINNKTGAKVMCVGDDFQSIYRFNGCDINMFINFRKYFKKSKILKIVNTYRNSQQLINVAGSFIMKNKNQIYKNLKSNKSINKPIKIMYGDSLNKLLDYIYNYHENILVLGRNNFDIENYFKLKENHFIYKDRKVKYLTVHSSKGLECECVVLINLKDDTLGFPNKIEDQKVLLNVIRSRDNYPYEEERRLFYVALTRTKSDVYLLVDKKRPSIFIKELINDYSKYIEYI